MQLRKNLDTKAKKKYGIYNMQYPIRKNIGKKNYFNSIMTGRQMFLNYWYTLFKKLKTNY